jgi:hypothetical protein
MPWYELGDAILYGSWKPFIWDEYETIICLRPAKPEVPGSNPGRRTIHPNTLEEAGTPTWKNREP